MFAYIGYRLAKVYLSQALIVIPVAPLCRGMITSLYLATWCSGVIVVTAEHISLPDIFL